MAMIKIITISLLVSSTAHHQDEFRLKVDAEGSIEFKSQLGR